MSWYVLSMSWYVLVCPGMSWYVLVCPGMSWYVLVHRRPEFPGLVSYNRFVELTPTVIIPLAACLRQRQGNCTGIAFMDATTIKVCHNQRIPRHKVFAGIAAGARPRWVGFMASNST